MHRLGREQGASQVLLHDMAMLKDGFALNTNNAIAFTDAAAFKSGVVLSYSGGVIAGAGAEPC